jgi:hypothetical protein
VDLDAMATIVFTSGTTGRPKGAVLSYANHLASADAWATVLAPRSGDRWLACLPLFHVAGLATVIRAGRWGVPLEVAGLRAGDVVARIEPDQPPLAGALAAPAAAGRGRPPVPPTLRAILLGGGPIPRAAAAGARQQPARCSTYGMTETASGLALGGAEAATLADPTALRALPGVEIRIGATGDGIGATEDGEGIGPILVRGPMVFGGYLGDAGATAERLGEGWLHTGDLCHLDEQGLLHVADRRDDLIISGGENVYPAEVEVVLLAHPAVAEAAVLGQPHAAWGSVPVAAIVTAADRDVSDAALEGYCRERLAGYKVPARWYRMASLPRSESGKILRRELREALPEEPGGPPTRIWRSFARVPRSPSARRPGPASAALRHALVLAPAPAAGRPATARFHVISVDRRAVAAVRRPPTNAVPIGVAVHRGPRRGPRAELRPLPRGRSQLRWRRPGAGRQAAQAGARPVGLRAACGPVAPPAGRRHMPGWPTVRWGLPARGSRLQQRSSGGVAGHSYGALTPAARARIGRAGAGAVADATLLGMDSAGLSRIQCPVLIATGSASAPPYGAIAEGLRKRIRDAVIERIAGADHMAPLTRPDVVAAAVEAFGAR